jgi:hypothetical protein
MHESFDIARRDINRDALLEAIGGCLRVEHGPVEESLPGRLAALLDQLQTESRNGIWALRVSSDEPLSADQGRNSVPVTSDKKGTLPLHGGASGSGGPLGAEWAISSRPADQGRACGAADSALKCSAPA